MTRFDPLYAQLLISNDYVSSHGNARDIINPSTLKPCGRVADTTPAEMNEALACAEGARPAWARLDAKTRAQLLHALAQSIESADKHDVAHLMTLEVGKPYPESVGELANVASVFRYYAEIARDDAGKIAGPIQIEAGGNDPLIVSDKAPLEVAIAGSVTAAFHLSGQICTSAERFLVHERVHHAFVDGLVREAKVLRIGDGLGENEIGPLVSQAARDKVIRLVNDAVAKGAKLHTGGRIPPQLSTGWFYEPTVLTGVTPDMSIFNEELLGPVAAICKVKSFQEAVAHANRSEFGLGANVFTTDLSEAMQAVEEIEAGMVWVNNPLIDNDVLPFGGWKDSGIGRSRSRHGLDAFRQSKMVVIDAQPHLYDWWYPYPAHVFYPSVMQDSAAKALQPSHKRKGGD